MGGNRGNLKVPAVIGCVRLFALDYFTLCACLIQALSTVLDMFIPAVFLGSYPAIQVRSSACGETAIPTWELSPGYKTCPLYHCVTLPS